MIPLKGYKIFISSPGDLEDEKETVKKRIHRFNFFHALIEGKIFIPFSSEEVSGRTGRGQEVINKKLHGADFLIVMFWKRWGTETGTGEYNSGTHEEYEIGKTLQNQGKLIERLVLFKNEDEPDPGDQLKQVRDFKKEIETNNEVLHKSFGNDLKLSDEIDAFLTEALAITKGEVIPQEHEVKVSDIVELPDV